MNNQTTIVLVHGFWGAAAHWSRVILELRRQGHTAIRALELPLTSPADDAERKRKMVAQVHGPVLLVGHSYGGAVISVAGNAPNVAGFVYIAAFAPGAGESAGGITQERMAARLQARKIITLNASHASLASRPVEVAALILEAAGAVAGA